jgi:hypothetical protein
VGYSLGLTDTTIISQVLLLEGGYSVCPLQFRRSSVHRDSILPQLPYRAPEMNTDENDSGFCFCKGSAKEIGEGHSLGSTIIPTGGSASGLWRGRTLGLSAPALSFFSPRDSIKASAPAPSSRRRRRCSLLFIDWMRRLIPQNELVGGPSLQPSLVHFRRKFGFLH